MSNNMLANMIHSAVSTLESAGVTFLPDVSVKLIGKPEDVAKAVELAKVELAKLQAIPDTSVVDHDDHADKLSIARQAVSGTKLVTHRQRVNKFVSDACSSRDGAAIATAMALRKVSFTVARAEARVNQKTTDASQPFAAAVCLIQAAEAIRHLHSVVDTGWTLPETADGFKPRKFKFATATATKRPELTDKTITAERAAQG